MAKVIVYNVYTQALETFYLEENDPMPYAYDRTMLVREFRGSSRSSVPMDNKCGNGSMECNTKNHMEPQYLFGMYLNESGRRTWEAATALCRCFFDVDRH